MSVTDSTSSVVSEVTQGSVALLCIAFMREAIVEMIPYLICAGVLILADLYFGVRASAKKGEEIRLSRMVRRTMGKSFEYLCWIMVSSTLSVAFDLKALEYVILGIVALNEIISIMTNWAYLHDKKVTINWMKLIGDKVDMDLEDNIKIEDNENKRGRHKADKGV